MSLQVLAWASLFATCSAMTVYNPANAGNAIDAIEQALAAVVNNPHLTAVQLKSAKKVTADVEQIVTDLESAKGKKLSKDARAAKVMSAIKELQGLQDQWQKVATQTIANKKADLMKQLQENQAKLEKEQKMLKVLNLEKQLAEKKLALEKLVAMKNAQEQAGAQEEAQKQAAAQQEMVASVLNMAKSLQAANGHNTSIPHAVKKAVDGKPAVLKTVLVYLEGRMHNITSTMEKLESAEKKREAELSNSSFAKAPLNGKDDAIGKGKSLLKILIKKEHRSFEKARAPLKTEFNELAEAVKNIKKGDIAGLTSVMSHMQNDMKSLQAKTHKFLY
jgi:hypothetical protein